MQCLRIQRALFEFVIDPASDGKLKPDYARAWCLVTERLRILKGKALPGEELRATTTGLALHSVLKRGRVRKLADFAFTRPAIADAVEVPGPVPGPTACGVQTPSNGSPVRPAESATPQSPEVPDS